MKKLLMMWLFISVAIVVYAQDMSEQEWWRQYYSYRCNGTETLRQCKIRNRRENIEKKRYEDSVKREGEAQYNAWRRELWEKERARRETLTPEQRANEDQERRLDFEADKKKKVDDGIDFTAGAIYSNISGAESNYNPLFGLLLGVHTKLIPLSDDIHVGVGVEYSMQGGKYKSTDYIPGGNYGTSSASTRLNYLNFPLLAHYQKAPTGFFAEAGVQPGILLSAKIKATNSTDIKDDLKKFDVGVPFGAGYKFKNKFGAGVRIVPGLMNINKGENLKNKNMVVSLRASYAL